MKARTRSISGALMMLVIIPLFAGLLACMPEYVPLGNPERARVDPGMSGLWFAPGDEALIGNIIFFQPWDKRTFLSVNVSIEARGELDPEWYDPDEFDMSTYAGFANVIDEGGLSDEDFEIGVVIHKSWLVKLGGEQFFTWELRGLPVPEESGFEPWYWMDFRIDEKQDKRIVMRKIDPEFPPLDEAPATKKAWEKVVRRHVDDPSMYMDKPIVLTRVHPEHEEMFSELVFDAMTRDSW